ncbi:hypothetical protein O181_020432 [Austropuccinia psidii MF-1]|uniref:Uncharacterized protein n=1 Tax=Austropuccinia psidii MF-1 TaxID=1389203 RepID=A0A9Q3GVB4_9BASI|nr:hypothetical protein [Austropuccinia psidii MF-1]
MSYRKGNIKLNPKFVVLEDVHTEELLLGTDYQRMYGIQIYNSKNRHITIVKNKKKKFPLDIYQLSNQNPSEELLNEFKEGKFISNLTSKQKFSLLKTLRNNRPDCAIVKSSWGKSEFMI